MNALEKADLDLRAALMLQATFCDGTSSEREEAARAVLQARAEVARARAEMAMGGTKGMVQS